MTDCPKFFFLERVRGTSYYFALLRGLFCFLALAEAESLRAYADPALPENPSEVLDTIPIAAATLSENTALILDEKLRQAPSEAQELLGLADDCIKFSLASSSPRFLGYARGLLSRVEKNDRDEKFGKIQRSLEHAFESYIRSPK